MQTLPEQVADHLGVAIARGEFSGGERLLEQEIAQRYGVSRGPVREALRILATRGLAVLYPRRGAFVVEFSLDRLVDLFNMRAVLAGLATRYFAILASDAALEEMSRAVEALRVVGVAPETDPLLFIQATARVGRLITLHCGSESLTRLIENENESSAWVTLWQTGRIDFQTQARRQAATNDYLKMGAALQRRDGAAAEAIMRHMVMASRENAVEALATIRREKYDTRRLLGA